MAYRRLVTKELAELFNVLAHPIRIRIIEELYAGERDVSSLAELLGLSQPGVSQHLSLLRGQRLVLERRQGRNVYYHLRHPEMARWILDGLRFVGQQQEELEQFLSAVAKARTAWSNDESQS